MTWGCLRHGGREPCGGRGLMLHVTTTSGGFTTCSARHSWVEPPGPATRLEIQVSHPTVKHEVTVQQLQRWAESSAITPDERIRKSRVLTMLG
jgi:hypothetical protein